MNKLIKILVKLSVVLVVIYTATWFGGAHFVRQKLANINDKSELKFSPVPSDISGFPFWPKMVYSGNIKAPKYSINVQGMEITIKANSKKGELAINMPNGFTLRDAYTKQAQEFKSSHINIATPYPTPKNNKKTGMEKWRDNGGEILVTDLLIQKKDIKITGTGTVSLDANLQPKGKIDLAINGYQSLLSDLGALGIIPKKEAGMIGTLLGGLFGKKKTNGNGNASTFKTPLVIQHGGLYIGPMKVGRINKIKWEN